MSTADHRGTAHGPAAPPTKPEDAGRHRVLPHDDVVRLARAYQAGRSAASALDDSALSEAEARQLRRLHTAGMRARDAIVVHNLRLVAHIARRHAVDGLTFDDHFQDGCRGLLRAVEKFDPDAGFRFSTYATWWIRQSITRGIADTARLIRLPVHVVDDLRRLDRARQRLVSETGRAPTAELVALTGFDHEKVERLRGLLGGPASLDAAVGDGLTTLGDLIPADDDGEVSQAELTEIVRHHLLVLSDREREVLELRYGLDGSGGRTLEQVGSIFGVTRERIRQIEAKALKKLRPAIAEALGRHLPPAPDENGRSVGARTGPPRDEGTGESGVDPGKVARLRTGLSPRGRRLLDELSSHPDGAALSEIRVAMGLPPSAPLEQTIDAVNETIVEAGLSGIVQRSGKLSMDSMLASSWRTLRVAGR